MVQDAFTEMDRTLATAQPLAYVHPPALAEPSYAEEAPIPSSMSWASDLGSLDSSSAASPRRERFSERQSVTPTAEEQAWLDVQMAENEFVCQMLRMHPNLQEDGEPTCRSRASPPPAPRWPRVQLTCSPLPRPAQRHGGSSTTNRPTLRWTRDENSGGAAVQSPVAPRRVTCRRHITVR